MATRPVVAAALIAVACGASAADLQEFSSAGLRNSDGIVVRVQHPADWRPVPVEDPAAIAELRGPEGRVTAILQLGRGEKRDDIASVCRPERATTMLQNLSAQEAGTRVTDVFARKHEGRPAFELRYERKVDGQFMAVRSLIVCLKDSRVLVSCAGTATLRTALSAIEPVCHRVLDSVRISED